MIGVGEKATNNIVKKQLTLRSQSTSFSPVCVCVYCILVAGAEVLCSSISLGID